jgi:hypothetical protein
MFSYTRLTKEEAIEKYGEDNVWLFESGDWAYREEIGTWYVSGNFTMPLLGYIKTKTVNDIKLSEIIRRPLAKDQIFDKYGNLGANPYQLEHKDLKGFWHLFKREFFTDFFVELTQDIKAIKGGTFNDDFWWYKDLQGFEHLIKNNIEYIQTNNPETLIDVYLFLTAYKS